jgi:hypothetical protein
MIVRGMINAGINNIIYMGLISGPKIANGKCRKTTDAGTMDRSSTVLMYYRCLEMMDIVINEYFLTPLIIFPMSKQFL